MKKSMAVVLAFIIGISTSFSGMSVMAAQKEETPDMKSRDAEKKSAKQNPKAGSSTEMPGMEKLRIPQRLEVVIDPWEMDGKSQIYSEKYTIRNTGETAGALRLSRLTCKPQEKSGVIVRTDKEGLHDNEEKALYMEMFFGNGETIVLSEEEKEYRTELKPGEEMLFWFGGEVNEYAADDWGNGTVTVDIAYSWKQRTRADGVSEEETGQVSDRDESPVDESAAGGGNPAASEITENEEELPRIDEFSLEQKSGENEEKSVKVVELHKFQKSKMDIDSWMIEENGQENKIVSEEYVFRNTGEMTGTLILDDLRCTTQELSGITVQTDKDGLYNSEGKAIYMEMVSGDGERMVLSQDGSGYQMELEPGEELSIRFVGEMNGNISEEPEKGIAEVMAVCSWNVEVAG